MKARRVVITIECESDARVVWIRTFIKSIVGKIARVIQVQVNVIKEKG
jgi:hypothetical protein